MGRRTGRRVGLLGLLGFLVLSLLVLVPTAGASSSTWLVKVRGGAKGASKVRGLSERARLAGGVMWGVVMDAIDFDLAPSPIVAPDMN